MISVDLEAQDCSEIGFLILELLGVIKMNTFLHFLNERYLFAMKEFLIDANI